MTKKSPILAVNEPVKKTTRKRSAPRKTAGSKKTASGRTSGRTSKGKKTIRRWNPNIQKVRAVVNGAPVRLHVCTSCIKAGKVTTR